MSMDSSDSESSLYPMISRLWDDCAGLNAATDKTSRNPKIQALIDEIINDGSTDDHTTPPEKKSPVDVFEWWEKDASAAFFRHFCQG